MKIRSNNMENTLVDNAMGDLFHHMGLGTCLNKKIGHLTKTIKWANVSWCVSGPALTMIRKILRAVFLKGA